MILKALTSEDSGKSLLENFLMFLNGCSFVSAIWGDRVTVGDPTIKCKMGRKMKKICPFFGVP